MGYRYIGSKARIADEIIEYIDYNGEGYFIDAFSGTGIVAQKAANKGWNVKVNDMMKNAVVMTVAGLMSEDDIQLKFDGGYEACIDYLNSLKPENDDIGNILNQVCISRMENYENTVNGVIDNYIELSKISLYELDSAYGNLNFIFSNKNIRLKAYNEIFNKIRTIKQKILEETYQFNLYKDNKGNFAVCMNKAIEVSKIQKEVRRCL